MAQRRWRDSHPASARCVSSWVGRLDRRRRMAFNGWGSDRASQAKRFMHSPPHVLGAYALEAVDPLAPRVEGGVVLRPAGRRL